MSKALALLSSEASPEMSNVNSPLVRIAREKLPQCAIDRGLPAIYRAQFFKATDFHVFDRQSLVPNPDDIFEGPIRVAFENER